MVQVRPEATSGSLFRSLERLAEYSELLKWIAKAKPKGPFTLQTVFHCQLSEESVKDASVMVGEFRASVWNKETLHREVQNFHAVVPEAPTLLLEANVWNGDGEDPSENVLLMEEPKKSNDGKGVS